MYHIQFHAVKRMGITDPMISQLLHLVELLKYFNLPYKVSGLCWELGIFSYVPSFWVIFYTLDETESC